MKSYVWKLTTDTTEDVTLAPATISKHTKRAKAIFTEAVDARSVAESAMAAVAAGGEVNRDRDHFIDAVTAIKVLESCPDPIYRLAFALARYGGFRLCEVLPVEWSDILWAGSIIRNRSPKTGER